jgi:hypothetical protein
MQAVGAFVELALFIVLLVDIVLFIPLLYGQCWLQVWMQWFPKGVDHWCPKSLDDKDESTMLTAHRNIACVLRAMKAK